MMKGFKSWHCDTILTPINKIRGTDTFVQLKAIPEIFIDCANRGTQS